MQFGAGYRNHRSEIKFLPFVEQFWYAGGEKAGKHHNLSRYSKLYGTELAISHWINARWKTSTLLELSEQRYKLDNRKLSNGNNYAISHTLGFYPSSSQYWFLGTDYYRKNARWRANAFERYGIRLGWSQMWSKGIATQLQLNYARRIYQMASAKPEDIFAPNFLNGHKKTMNMVYHSRYGSVIYRGKGLHRK